MTVNDWIAKRSDGVPEALLLRVREVLGAGASEPAARAGAVCLSAATRALDDLLAAGQHGREIALQLLAIDALTTFAFEHASEAGSGPEALKLLATDGARALSQLATARG